MIKTGFELPTALTREDIVLHDTLMYNPKDGYTWVRQSRDDQPTWPDSMTNWQTKAPSNVEALRLAREAGFNPTAVYYVRES